MKITKGKITKTKATKTAKTKEEAKEKEKKEEAIGEVTHFFGHVPAAAVKLKKPLKIGETVHIKGHTTDIIIQIGSMQVNHKPVQAAKKGESIGIQVSQKCREHDVVYKVN